MQKIIEKIHSAWYNLGHWFKFKGGRRFFFVLCCILILYGYLKYDSLMLPAKTGDFSQFLIEVALDFILALLITVFVICVEGVFDSFINEHPRADSYLKQTSHDLKILGMTLNSLHKEAGIVDAIAGKFNEERNIYKFRFLLLNPCSSALRERGNIEEKDHNLLRIECAKSVKNLDEIREKVEEKIQKGNGIFEYRFYDILPSHGLIITDKTGWVGPFLYQKAGTTTKWFQINNYQAYSQYDSEFEAIWNLKGRDIKDKKTGIIKKLCFSKEELSEIYPEIDNLFLISKNIPLKVFDEVLLQQKTISKEKYEELVEIAKIVKNNFFDITEINFEIVGSATIIFNKNNERRTINFQSGSEGTYPNS